MVDILLTYSFKVSARGIYKASLQNLRNTNRKGLDGNPDYTFSGDSDIKALDFVYKWSSNGNNKLQNVKF